jgi:alpha-mannosidase
MDSKLGISDNLTELIKQLRSQSRLSILDNWQRQDTQGVWQNLVPINSKRNTPMLAFLKNEVNVHIEQVWQVPETYGGLRTAGAIVRLSLIWWADICEVWINGQKVQEGDLFDQKVRILLTDHAKPQSQFAIAIKLNSPKHDIGAVQLSELIFEYPLQPYDPDQLATELEILQTYLPIFDKQQIDVQPLETVIQSLQILLANSQLTSEQFFTQLAKIREPLLGFSNFLKQRQVYILGNAHIDVAWLWAIAETKNAMQRTFTSALNLQKHYPELIFNQSTAVSYQWMEQENPELFAQIQAAVAANKWELIGGMWVEPDGNLPSGESLIRQILYGQEYFRKKFNREVKIAWLPDTFGFHWQMPQILLKSGFETFVTQKLMWNDTNKFPHQVFWWEGVDGSRIFTYFSNEIGLGLEPVAIAKYLASQEDKHNIPETTWLYGVGDHGGGPTADMLDMGRKWADAPLFFTMQPSRLEDFLINLKSQKSKLIDELPVWQDELYLEFHRGTFTTKAEQKRQNRQVEVLIGNAEKFSAIANLINQIDYPQAQLETAWQGLLLNQFHDILPGTSIPEVFADADRTWTEVREICDRILDDPNSERTNPQAWNFLNWSRSQLIRTDTHPYWLTVPSFGFTTVDAAVITKTDLPLKITSDHDQFHLENQYLQVTVNRHTGAIEQIFDLRSQRNILRSANELQFFADQGQYWDAWNIDPDYENQKLESAVLESIEIVENNSLVISLRIVQTFRNSTFIQEIQLTAFEDFVTVQNSVDWQEEHILVKVAFPISWQSPYATYEIPMGTIQRSTLAETAEAKAKWEVPAQYWADIATDGIGLAVLNNCKYGYDAKPDCLRLTLLRSPHWPSPDSDRGNHQFAYRLVPHQGDWRKANIVQLGQEFNHPIVINHLKNQSHQASFLQVSAPNIILSALKRSQDQSAWIFRFYEAHGQLTEAKIDISSDLLSIKEIWECDLMEQVIIAIANAQSNSSQITFQPYEIKTLRVAG